MRSARPTFPLLLLAVLLTVSACSGAPSSRAWATSVCGALAPWRAEISTLASRTNQQMTAETTPEQAKENLVRLFGGAEQASEKARAGVADAGVPDVDGGEQVAGGFTAALSAMRDAYGRARAAIEGLATRPAAAFYDQVSTVVQQLGTEYEQSGLDTGDLDSEELRLAFDETPECR